MAYRADIEIGVRGTEKLRDLRKTIDDLADQVRAIDSYADVFKSPIQSIRNYNQTLQTAVEILNKVELGTIDEVTAVKTYVRALGEANEAQNRQNKLIQETIKLFEEEERVRRLTAAGIFETTRFKQPIGPARPPGAVPAGGFPVAGPQTSPGFTRTQKDIGRFGENLALGAGFPLLFGGGPGTVAGSILGSFVGTGFGGQILGGALGQVLDQAVQKTAQLGSALQTLNLEKLRQSGVQVNATLETQLTLLRQAGNAVKAQELVQRQVLATTGALPGTVEDISNATNILGAAWSEFTTAAGVTLGIVGAPFAAALGAIISGINVIIKGLNVALSAVGSALKTTGEWVATLLGGKDAVKNIEEAFRNLNSEIQKARAEYQPILSALNGEVLLNREILNLEKQKTAATTAADKQRNAALAYQQTVVKANAEADDKIRSANEKITEATKTQVNEQVRLLNLRRDQTIEAAKLTLELEKQRIADAEREAAARRAKEAQQAALDRVRAQVDAEKTILNERLKLIDINIREQEFLGGEEAGLKRSLALTDAKARVTAEILSAERYIAVLDARKTGTEREAREISNLRLKNAQYIANLEQANTAERLKQKDIERFRSTQTAVQAAIQPFESVRINRELEIKYAKTYQRLVMEGLLPAEAERIASFEKLTTQQTISIEKEILLTTAILARAKALGANTIELEKQLDVLNNVKAAITAQTSFTPLKNSRGSIAQARMSELKGTFNELVNIENIGVSAANNIGQAFGQAFQQIATGSASTQDALSQMFKNIGENFINMAAQIIAQQMTMIVLGGIMKALGMGLSSGTPGGGTSAGFGVNTPDMMKYAPLTPYADGGFVTGPTRAVVGEGGEPEYIIPASKMSAAMQRYSAGARGSAVIPSSGATTEGDTSSVSGGTAVAGGIDVRFNVERINSVDYVTADQFQAGIRQAAQQGATQGEQRTLRRLQQSRSTRSRLGMA